MITADSSSTRDTRQMSVTEEPTILRFEGGIIGLPAVTQFVLTSVSADAPPDALFQLLRSVDGEVSIVVTQPWLLFPDYNPDLPNTDLSELGISSSEQMTIFNPVVLDADEGCVYVNLMGPFVVNVDSNAARQVVLADSEWPLRARVDLS